MFLSFETAGVKLLPLETGQKLNVIRRSEDTLDNWNPVSKAIAMLTENYLGQ